MIAEHYEAMLSFYGVEIGLRLARKHLGWYAEAAAAPLRAEMMRSATPAQTLALIRDAFGEKEAA
jgi:tRNA-dihydrouridine synthase